MVCEKTYRTTPFLSLERTKARTVQQNSQTKNVRKRTALSKKGEYFFILHYAYHIVNKKCTASPANPSAMVFLTRTFTRNCASRYSTAFVTSVSNFNRAGLTMRSALFLYVFPPLTPGMMDGLCGHISKQRHQPGCPRFFKEG